MTDGKKISIKKISLIVAVCGGLIAYAAIFYFQKDEPAITAGNDHMAFVAVTDGDLKEYGPFPFDRKLIAQAVAQVHQDGARAAVLKFFYDRPTPSDALLAQEMTGFPTLVQQGIKVPPAASEGSAEFKGVSETLVATIGDAAAGKGFVEVRQMGGFDRVELSALIDGKPMPSLQLLAAERATGSQAVISKESISIAGHKLMLDNLGRAICPYRTIKLPDAVSLHALLSGKEPAAQFKDKLVVIGYLASDSPTVTYPRGRQMPIHEVFYQQVSCLIGG